MTKTITKVGNSQGIIFDSALMDLARIKVGDQVNVTVVPGERSDHAHAVAAPSLRKKKSARLSRRTARDYRKNVCANLREGYV